MIQSQPTLIQQNFVQAPPMLPPQSGNAIQIQHQPTIIPHSVPMQIINQTPITIPPPSIPLRTIQTNNPQPIVQLQQQPANIQIQANAQPTQVSSHIKCTQCESLKFSVSKIKPWSAL